ncbi:glycosyl transferase family group 2-domain-containing protein [Pterulicium gracile]|uniref:Glycosyl transferase family group 2-domain-containing protein n=1 Tax=Pterulicium gracile TaxID=1884261 RepID=A0A5C3Q5R1_9AGAR|nr:glycosyl transferase family group 2-domain-containing protein [Pterula gracilis]
MYSSDYPSDHGVQEIIDYDIHDAILHHLYKSSQIDTLFSVDSAITTGVCLRTQPGHFRLFPYDEPRLLHFEAATRALNPLVAIKVRTAAIHAALSTLNDNDIAIFINPSTRIQVLDTIAQLGRAEKEQCGAFIRDERVLIVWSDSLETIISIYQDFEAELIALVWNNKARLAPAVTSDSSGTLKEGASSVAPEEHIPHETRGIRPPKKTRTWGWSWKAASNPDRSQAQKDDPEKSGTVKRRKIRLFAPLYNGIGTGLAAFFIISGLSLLLQEFRLDGSYTRFALVVTFPFLFCVALFFCLQLVGNLALAFGPVAQYHENSQYYSAVKPESNLEVDRNLPHMSIQIPVYKEGLEAVIAPSVFSIKAAMQTYARQGGTSSIFVNDDGLQLLSAEDRAARIAFYSDHNIGWVARPKHEDKGGGFKRRGRFKKASNMNYALDLSLRMEKFIRVLVEERERSRGASPAIVLQQSTHLSDVPDSSAHLPHPDYSAISSTSAYPSMDICSDEDRDLEEKALEMAIEEVYEESGKRHRPWAANARSLRVGGLILICDSDTIVPEDCFRDAAREMAESPELAIIQHESDVMQVSFNFFENGIAHFTRRINRCISMGTANGEIAPFVGHNAFLRWSAIQDASFIDPYDNMRRFWSEANVSEDFDMALRLQLSGYIIRWATYSEGGFKEGVSLTVDDELNRWQKYAYGCNELIFLPLVEWWKKGIISKQLQIFIWSGAPVHYKLSMMAYMFSYYGIACSAVLTVLNYFLVGFEVEVDAFYLHSFEIFLACCAVFPGLGNLGFTLMQYRLGQRSFLSAAAENLTWVPFFFFFFGGLSVHLSVALLSHLFSYNIQWGATKKEVERSNFFIEVPKIINRFSTSIIFSLVTTAAMIIFSTDLVTYRWRIPGENWAAIFPTALVVGSHFLFPVILNPWLMIFSY